MRNKRRLYFVATLLSLLFVLVPSSYAAAEVELTVPSSYAATEVELTVPAKVDIILESDGSDTVIAGGEDAYCIENSSLVPITLENIVVTKVGEWDLVSWGTDFPKDTKKIAMKLGDQALQTGDNQITDLELQPADSRRIAFDIQRGPWTQNVLAQKAFDFQCEYQWGTAEFTLTLDPNGGSLPTDVNSTITLENGQTHILPSAEASDQSYYLAGWKDENGVMYEAGSAYTMPIGNMTLTAVWKETPQLMDGLEFYKLIPENATSIIITDIAAPGSATLTDVSEKGNGSVMAWLEGNTWYVSSQVKGMKVWAPEPMYTFGNAENVEEIDLSNLDISSSTDTRWMFSQCKSLKTLDVSGLDTSKATWMNCMFEGCASLENLDLSSLDTSSATKFGSMFDGCTSLKTVDLSGWNTAKVTDMANMFEGCASLKTLDLSSFNTTRLTDITAMFYGCRALTAVDMSSFNTPKLRDLDDTFNGCASLTELDFSNFDLTTANNYNCVRRMLQGTTSLQILHLPEKFFYPDYWGLDGTWYNAAGDSFTAETIPTDVADTYYKSLDLIPTAAVTVKSKTFATDKIEESVEEPAAEPIEDDAGKTATPEEVREKEPMAEELMPEDDTDAVVENDPLPAKEPAMEPVEDDATETAAPEEACAEEPFAEELMPEDDVEIVVENDPSPAQEPAMEPVEDDAAEMVAPEEACAEEPLAEEALMLEDDTDAVVENDPSPAQVAAVELAVEDDAGIVIENDTLSGGSNDMMQMSANNGKKGIFSRIVNFFLKAMGFPFENALGRVSF